MKTFYHILYHWLLGIFQPLRIFFPDDLGIDEKRKRAMVIICAFAGIPLLLFFMYDDAVNNEKLGVIVNLGLAILLTTFLLFSRFVRNGVWFYRILAFGLTGVLMYNQYFGPSGDSSLVWLNIFPLAVFFVLGITEGFGWYCLVTTVSMVLLFAPDGSGTAIYSDDMRVRHVCTYVIITFMALSFEFLRWYFYTQLEHEREKLKEAAEHVRTLNGLVPICSICKKIRDDKGYWNQLEQYLLDHTNAKLTHGICDDCYAKHYPKEFARRKTKTIRVEDIKRFEKPSDVDET